MRTFWGCGRAGQGKSTLMEVGSAGMKGSGDRDCGEDVRCDHPRGEAAVQAGATGCSNAYWQRAHGWRGTMMEGHGCGWEGDPHPSARASTDVGFRQQ